MRFLLDENFPKSTGEWLKQHGHSVFDFRGTCDEGIDDASVFRKAQELDAVLQTTDRDFYHTVPHLFATHAGVVVVALRQPNRKAILERLEWALAHIKSDAFRGRAFQLRDSNWMAYPPLG